MLVSRMDEFAVLQKSDYLTSNVFVVSHHRVTALNLDKVRHQQSRYLRLVSVVRSLSAAAGKEGLEWTYAQSIQQTIDSRIGSRRPCRVGLEESAS